MKKASFNHSFLKTGLCAVFIGIAAVGFSMIFQITAAATIYTIPVGGISDHSDPNVAGSIAWYFNTYGADQEYRLSSSATYPIEDSLTLPEGATLTKIPGSSARIQAGSGCAEEVMLNMNSGSTVKGWSASDRFELDGNRQAKHIIQSLHATHIAMRYCTLHKTKNNYANGEDPRLHLIVVKYSTDVLIKGNLLRRAGCEPKENGEAWAGQGAAIYAPQNTNLQCLENDISYTLTAGIDFTGTLQVNCIGNGIHNTGMNKLYGGPSSDGITAYHNNVGCVDLEWNITDNLIRNYYHHGIHVSGRGINIERNCITNGLEHAIRLYDRYVPHDCSSDVLISDNYLSTGGDGFSAVVINYYEAGTIQISGNTGDTNDVVWGNQTCSCD